MPCKALVFRFTWALLFAPFQKCIRMTIPYSLPDPSPCTAVRRPLPAPFASCAMCILDCPTLHNPSLKLATSAHLGQSASFVLCIAGRSTQALEVAPSGQHEPRGLNPRLSFVAGLHVHCHPQLTRPGSHCDTPLHRDEKAEPQNACTICADNIRAPMDCPHLPGTSLCRPVPGMSDRCCKRRNGQRVQRLPQRTVAAFCFSWRNLCLQL